MATALIAGFTAPTYSTASALSGTSADPFFSYSGDAPLGSFAPGDVLKTRTIAYHLVGVPTPLRVAQILYRTTSQLGRPAANVTSVLLPPGGGAGSTSRAVAYQSAYDSNSIADAPSRAIAGDVSLPGLAASFESAALTSLLGSGFAVIIADDEGADSAFGMGRQYGMATLDSLRAALAAPEVTGLAPDAKIGMFGYSGGAIATGWAAQLQPDYAPELTRNLVGAAYGGITVAPSHSIEYVGGTAAWSLIIPTALAGAVRAYGIDLDAYANDYGKFLVSWASDKSLAYSAGVSAFTSWQKMVLPQYANPNSVPEYVRIVNDNNMGLAPAPTMPVFLAQGGGGILNGTPPSAKWGDGDGATLVKDVRALGRMFCANGTRTLYREYPFLEHAGAAGAFFTAAVPWLNDRFAGKPAPSSCGLIPPGNSLAAETPVPPGTPAG